MRRLIGRGKSRDEGTEGRAMQWGNLGTAGNPFQTPVLVPLWWAGIYSPGKARTSAPLFHSASSFLPCRRPSLTTNASLSWISQGFLGHFPHCDVSTSKFGISVTEANSGQVRQTSNLFRDTPWHGIWESQSMRTRSGAPDGRTAVRGIPRLGLMCSHTSHGTSSETGHERRPLPARMNSM